MNPKVKIREKNDRCCLPQDSVDKCGRSDCLWPCPAMPASVSQSEKYQHLTPNIQQQQQAFLLETSGSPQLDFRQACSGESLVYRNPNLTVHLLRPAQVKIATY